MNRLAEDAFVAQIFQLATYLFSIGPSPHLQSSLEDMKVGVPQLQLASHVKDDKNSLDELRSKEALKQDLSDEIRSHLNQFILY